MPDSKGWPQSAHVSFETISQQFVALGVSFGIPRGLLPCFCTYATTDRMCCSITFEHVPSDYAILKMTVVPETGGDTIWASGYEAYDRLSPAWKRFAESLTATHHNVSTPDYYDGELLNNVTTVHVTETSCGRRCRFD